MSGAELSPAVLAEVMEATWPAESRAALGPFTLRQGAGGGQRVSAATVEGAFTDSQLQAAIAELQASRFDERERLRVQALDPEL